VKRGGGAEATGLIGRLSGYYFRMIDGVQGLGYSAGAIEDFHREMENVLKGIADGTMTIDMLETTINEAMVSNSLVFFCRMVASCHIQTHSQHFAPFLGLEGGEDKVRASLKEYCAKEVEPLEKEVEEMEVMALASAFDVGLRIEHMDASAGPVNHHDLPHGASPHVFMLYRPGHYDLIYPPQ